MIYCDRAERGVRGSSGNGLCIGPWISLAGLGCAGLEGMGASDDAVMFRHPCIEVSFRTDGFCSADGVPGSPTLGSLVTVFECVCGLTELVAGATLECFVESFAFGSLGCCSCVIVSFVSRGCEVALFNIWAIWM